MVDMVCKAKEGVLVGLLVMMAPMAINAQTNHISDYTPKEIYEGETLAITLTLTDTAVSNWMDTDSNASSLISAASGGSSGTATHQATSGGTGDWYLAADADGTYLEPGAGDPYAVARNQVLNDDYSLNDDDTLTFYLHANTDNDNSESDETIVLRSHSGGYYNTENFSITLKNGLRPVTDGVTVSETSLTLTELGADSAVEKTYTVVLATDPTADVTLTVTNGDATAVAVDTDAGTDGNQSTLTFTAGGDGSGSGQGNGNWAVAQTVTVRALNDGDAAGESFNLTHAATAVGNTAPYHGIAIDPVAITTTDAGHGVVVSEASVSVRANDATVTYTLALKSQPSGNVVITATSGATANAEVDTDTDMQGNQGTLTFTDANWNTPQTVTITGKGAGSTSISHTVSMSADTTNYPTSTTIPAVSVTVTADPRPTVSLSPSLVTVTEGANAVFTVTLSAALGTGVTIPLNVTALFNATAGDDYTVPDPSSVTIAAGQTEAMFTLATIDDDAIEVRELIGVAIDTTTLPVSVRPGAATSGQVILISNDDPILVAMSEGRVAVREGESVAVSFALAEALDRDVQIPILVDGSGAGGATPGTDFTDPVSTENAVDVTVTIAAGDTTGRVTVATLQDTAAEYRETFDVELPISGDGLSALHRQGLQAHDDDFATTIQILDDDGVVLTESSGSTVVHEDGTTDSYQVRMLAPGVTFLNATIVATAGTGVQVSPAGATPAAARSMNFTSSALGNQTVHVHAVDDAVDNPGGHRMGRISHVATDTTDGAPRGQFVPDILVTIQDDDPTTVTLAGAAGNLEEGESKEVTIALGRGLVAGEVLTVPLTFGGTATRGTDYTLTGATADGVQYSNLNSGTATVVFTGPQTGATATTATLTLSATTDSTVESTAETVVIGLGTLTDTGLTNFGGVSETDSLADFTITDPPPAGGVTVSASSLALTELGADSAVAKTYTVVLATDPTADVTITVANGDATAVAVDTDAGTDGNQSTLTFTHGNSGNWNTPQTVTVRALNDGDGANESFTLTHTATAVGSTAPYHGIAIDPVAVTVMDAGHGVVVSESSVSVAENDATVTYTVVLKSRPSGNVVITPTSGATGTATVSPGTLTFTNTNWNTPKTVTITGKGAGSTAISHAVMTTADTTNYPMSLTLPGVSVTVTADSRQVLDLSMASATRNEGASVTVTMTATGASGSQTVAGGTSLLTFTGDGIASSDYSVAAANSFALTGSPPATTVVLTLVDDAADEPNEILEVGWQNLPAGFRAGTTASVTIVDQDPTTVTLAGSGTVAEDGSDATDITVTLSRRLYAGETVTVPLTLTGTGITAGDYTLVRTPGGGLNTGVTLNTNAPHSAATPAVVFSGHDTNVVQVATLRVRAQPDRLDEGTSEVVTVGFGSGNRAVMSTLDRATGTGTTGTTTAGSATVTITDDDQAGLTLTPTGAATVVSEDGSTTTDSYALVLASEPTHAVTVTVSAGSGVQVSTDGGANYAASRTLTFTSSTWNVAQTVTVKGVNDNVDNAGGGRDVTIGHATSSTDPRYTLDPAGSVEVRVTDDDATAVTLAGAAGDLEEGESKDITIALGRGLVAGEVLTVPLTFGGTATRGTDYTLAGTQATGVQYNSLNSGSATVVFTGPTSGTTATTATLTLSATTDSIVESPAETVVIGLGTLTNTGLTNAGGVSETDSLGDFSISDPPPAGGVTVSEASLALTELGAPTAVEKTYTLVLATDPGADVTITVTNGDTSAVAVDTDAGTSSDQNTLTFTAGGDGSGSGQGNGNWAVAQTVTVRALNDGDGTNESFNLTHTATAVGSTAPYHGIAIDPVAVTVMDAGHGVVVSESSVSVAENDETVTYTLVLKSRPAGTVVITATSGATGTATVSPGTLTFTNTNWNTPKTVTITGKGDGATSITHAVSTSADTTNYPTTTSIDPVSVTVTEVIIPTLKVESAGGFAVAEGDAFTVTLTLSQAATRAITLTVGATVTWDCMFITCPDGATMASTNDVSVVTARAVMFALGETTKTVDIMTTEDSAMEGTELFVLDVSGLSANEATIDPETSPADFMSFGLPHWFVRLLDDDTTPTVSIAGGPVVAEGDPAQFTVSVAQEVAADLQVGLTVADVAGSDFIAAGNEGAKSVTIAKGTTSAPYEVPTVDDGTIEADGDITVAITTGSAYTIGTSPAMVTVRDDDGTGVTVAPTALALTELGTPTDVAKTYTLVLGTDPGADVTITVTNGDATAVTVDTDAGTSGDQNTLTFTHGNSGNWGTAQTVTVRARNDGDGTNEAFTLTHAATAVGSTAPYHNIMIDPVAITTTDAGHGLVVSATSLSVVENDQTATYTVVLKSQPAGDVVIAVTSDATTMAEVDTDTNTVGTQGTLTFTNANWNVPQTVTITGKGRGATAIRHAVMTTADTTNYPMALTLPSVAVTVDAVVPEIAMALQIGDGRTRNTQGQVPVAESEGSVGTGFPLSADAVLVQNLTVCVRVTETGGARVTDGIKTVVLTSSGTTNGAGTYQLTWDDTAVDDPDSVVTVTVVAPNTAGCAAAAGSYTVSTTQNADTVRIEDNEATTVALTGTDVRMAEGNSSDTAQVRVALSRRLVAGETIAVPMLALATTTGARLPGTATPDFTLSAAGNGVTAANLNSAAPTLTFTGHGTDVVQTATLTATPSSTTDADTANESLTVTLPTDPELAAASATTVSGGVRRDGTAHTVGWTLLDSGRPTTNLVVIEQTGTPPSTTLVEGGTDTYTVTLASLPSHDVTVTATAPTNSSVTLNTAGGTPGKSQTLTFRRSGATIWSTPQTLTVSADDNVDHPDTRSETVTVSHAASSMDPDYTLPNAGAVAVTVTGDDDPTVVTLERVAGNTGDRVEGSADAVEFTVTLSRALVAGEQIDVPLRFRGTTLNNDYEFQKKAGTGVTIQNRQGRSPTVRFTGAGAQVGTFTMTARKDTQTEGTETVVVEIQPGGGFSQNTIGGGAERSATTYTFSFSILDPGDIVLTETSGGTVVSEDGTTTTDNYDITLGSQPTHDVTVTVSAASGVEVSKDGGTSYAASQTLTFTNTTWNTAQTITVKGVPDSVDNPGGGRDVTLSHAATSSALNYTLADTDDDVAVRVTDDDATTVVLAGAAGNINEGQTKEFTIELGRGLVDGESLTVPLTFGGTAVRGTDYTLADTQATGVQYNNLNSGSATVVFTGPTSGTTATTATLTLSATADSTVESPAETVIIGLGPLTNTGLTNAGGVTKTDNLGDFSIADPPATAAVTVSATALALTELGAPTDVAKTYTIVLATDPGADVTLTVANGDATAVAVDTDAGTSGDQTTLTFTHGNSGNWGTAQTVTVRARNDADAANESVTLTHTATAASGPYNGVTIAPVTITTTDAGHGVVVSEASVTVADNDDTATYTLVLKSQPAGNVVITPTSGVTTTATVAPPSLTFTNADWNRPQTVTITGKGAGTTAITHAVTTATTTYPASTSIPAVAVTVTSTVPPGVTLTATGGSTVVSEDGSTTTDSYDLVLTSAPTHDVTVTVSAGSGVEVSKVGGSYASSQTVTFTPSGNGLWSTAQTITVRGVDDSVDNAGGGRDVAITHAASSTDPAYNTLPVDSVDVRVTDDDPTTVVLAGAAGNINEGQTKEITLTLGRGLVNGESLTVPLTFSGTATRGTDYTLAGTVADGVQYNSLNTGSATVVFTGPQTGATATTATITLSATDDSTVESPAETVIIGLGTPTNTGLTNAGGVDATDSLADFTIADAPATATPGVTVSTTSLALTELGTPTDVEKTYTLVLDTDPGADVTIAVANGDATAVAVDTEAGTSGDQTTLTFTHGTSGNWNTAQTVTVRARNDADAAGESFNLTHTATAASGPYNGVTIAPVAITTTDAGHGVVVSQASVAVAENDDTATYTLVLTSQPAGNVVISATSGAPTTAEVDTDTTMGGNQGTLTFTNADWNTPQTVTITGKGAGSTSISHAVQSSGDATNYPTSTSIPAVAVTVTATATPGVTVAPTSLALTELGPSSTRQKTYTLVLATDPGADVTITVANGDTTAVAVDTDAGTSGDQTTLTFTARGDGSGSGAGNGNWAVAQTVTVRALNDGDGANESFNITHSASAARGPYNTIAIDPVAVTTTDAGHGVVVSQASVAVAENDDTATYTLVLTSQPAGNVVISATSGAPTTAEVDTDTTMGGNQGTLTFTTANWNTPQTVTITGKGAGSTSITHVVSTSADTTNYPTSTSIPSVAVSVTATATPGVNIQAKEDPLVVKEGQTATYTLVLTSTPQTNVVISVTAQDPAIAKVEPKMLTFTPQNARTPQTVTVRGVADGRDTPSPRTTVIAHGVVTTNDPDYRGFAIDSVTVMVEAKEVPLAEAGRATSAGLTRFGRTVGQQAVDAVRDRVGADRTRGFVSRLAGETLPRITGSSAASDGPNLEDGRIARPYGFATAHHQSDGFGRENDTDVTRALSDEDALRGTSFTLNTLKADGTSLAFWGKGSIAEFRGTAEGRVLAGEVRDVMMGTDRLQSDRLTGVMAIGSRGDITYRFGADTGRLETALTALVPYGSRDLRNGVSLWGAVGVGWGTLTVTPEGQDPVTGPIDWHMVAGGLAGRLAGVDLLPAADLGWHTDALWTRTRSEPSEALPALGGTTTRVRLGVDATWPATPALKGLVAPHAGVGIRYDGGDAETGFGLEVSSGMTWHDPDSTLSIRVEGRTLAVHEDGNFRDWGLTFGVSWDPRPDTKEGVSAMFGYDLGNVTSGADPLLGPETYPEQMDTDGGTRWRSEVAFGVSQGGGMVGSPYGGLRGTSDDVEAARVGYRIEPDTPNAEKISLDVWADPVAEDEDTSTGAGLMWRW